MAGESGGNTENSKLINGYDENGDLWVDGKKAIVKRRKPRWTKQGSLSRNDYRKVGGDQRDLGAGVKGSVNTEHYRGLNRSMENIALNNVDPEAD